MKLGIINFDFKQKKISHLSSTEENVVKMENIESSKDILTYIEAYVEKSGMDLLNISKSGYIWTVFLIKN